MNIFNQGMAYGSDLLKTEFVFINFVRIRRRQHVSIVSHVADERYMILPNVIRRCNVLVWI